MEKEEIKSPIETCHQNLFTLILDMCLFFADLLFLKNMYFNSMTLFAYVLRYGKNKVCLYNFCYRVKVYKLQVEILHEIFSTKLRLREYIPHILFSKNA